MRILNLLILFIGFYRMQQNKLTLTCITIDIIYILLPDLLAATGPTGRYHQAGLHLSRLLMSQLPVKKCSLQGIQPCSKINKSRNTRNLIQNESILNSWILRRKVEPEHSTFVSALLISISLNLTFKEEFESVPLRSDSMGFDNI